MPVSLLNADTSFPSFTEGTSTSEKVDVMMNYLYMLLEELRYTFGNLGTENFNDKSLDELSVQLTKPVYGMIEEETEGLKHEFEITAKGLQSQVTSVDGRITSLSTTVDGLNTRVSDAEGRVSSLTQTVNGFETRVSNAEGKVSTLTQTVNTFDVKITNAVNNANDAKTLAASLSVDVDDNSASISQIVSAVGSNGRVTAASIVSAVNSSGSSVKIRADKVDISGFVTFADLGDNGTATIAGNRISLLLDGTYDNGYSSLASTNELQFIYVTQYGSMRSMASIYTKIDGSDSDVTSRYALCIDADAFNNSNGTRVHAALKLFAAGRMSLESQYSMYIGNRSSGLYGSITIDADDVTCIRAYNSYSVATTSGKGVGYCFCKDGIYYNGSKIVST